MDVVSHARGLHRSRELRYGQQLPRRGIGTEPEAEGLQADPLRHFTLVFLATHPSNHGEPIPLLQLLSGTEGAMSVTVLWNSAGLCLCGVLPQGRPSE